MLKPIFVLLLLLLAITGAQADWEPPGSFYSDYGIEPGHLDDAEASVWITAAQAILDDHSYDYGDPLAAYDPEFGSAAGVALDSPVQKFLARWRVFALEGRPFSEVCMSAGRYLGTLPDADYILAALNDRLRSGAFGDKWRLATLVEADPSSWTTVPITQLAMTDSVDPYLRESAAALGRYFSVQNGDRAVLQAVQNSCQSGELRVNAWAQQITWAPTFHKDCDPFDDHYDRATYASVPASLIQLLVPAGVRRLSFSCVDADLDLTDAQFDSIRVSQSYLSLFLPRLSAGTLVLDRVNSDGRALVIRDASFSRSVDISGVRASAVDASYASFGGQATFRDSTLSGSLSLTGGTFSALQVYRNSIGGNLSVSRIRASGVVNIGFKEFGNFVRGNVDLYTVDARELFFIRNVVGGQLSLNEASISGTIRLSQSAIGGGAFLMDAEVKAVKVVQVVAPKIVLSGTNVAGTTEVSGKFDQIWTQAMRTGSLYVNYVSRGDYTQRVDWQKSAFPSECFDADVLSSLLKSANPNGLTDADVATAGLIPDEGLCAADVHLDVATVDDVLYVEGNVLRFVDVNDVVARHVAIGTQGGRFANRSCISARSLKADVLEVDGKTPWDDRGAYAPGYFDLTGAEVRIIGTSYSEIPKITDRRALVSSYLALFVNPSKTGCNVNGLQGAGEGTYVYRPSVFDLLARSFQANGDSDLAREVAIQKNLAYAQSLQFVPNGGIMTLLTRFVYRLAEVLTGFGYDNLRAVLWLLGLFFAGVVASLVDQWFRARARTQSRPTSRSKGKASRTPPKQAPAQAEPLNHFLLGLDRVVPSLGLDNAFGSLSDKNMSWQLKVVYYAQRAFAFIIIAFTIAGAFNLFQ